ncbi:response regulator [Streptomyces scabiei]|uniref:Response regulator PleD n=1 Tax=Streptomyces scabiei TaxID=1930 RepID=A0A100JYW0_STRSC|nr:response regulator [Streptomyces scabiei]GAQ68205.1 response regulator PleD [Streptomyces scabiei]
MPEMDGCETAVRVKARVRTRDIPIIFVSTGAVNPERIFRGYAAGAVDNVERPFDPWVLRAKVAVFVELSLANRRLRKQAAWLGTGPAHDLLAQMSTLLPEAERQAHHLTEQLQTHASRATARTTAARLETAVRNLRHVLQGALELEKESGAPPAPASLHSPRHRDR